MTGATITLGGRRIAAGSDPFIIAEIGVNHDGDIARARELLRAAKSAGADAAKFQMFDADMLLSRDAVLAAYQRERGARDPRELLRGLQIDPEPLGWLAEECIAVGIAPMVTVFSLPLFAHARTQRWSAFKTASPDLVNLPLLREAASIGRPLVVSTGAATRSEVERAARWLAPLPELAFLQCTSSYPTDDDRAAIGGMIEIAAVTGRAVGYSDHTAALDTGALAVAAGACILEKHLTYDRAAHGPDHSASLDPAQFGEYVRLARRAACMVGSPLKELQDIERDVRSVSRQSLVAVREIAAGSFIAREDLTVKRPGTGICASRIDEVVGRRAARAIMPDHVLHDADLAPVRTRALEATP